MNACRWCDAPTDNAPEPIWPRLPLNATIEVYGGATKRNELRDALCDRCQAQDDGEYDD